MTKNFLLSDSLKTVLFFALVLFPALVFSQTKFEQGYFVDNSGKATACLIKNIDWLNNPREFEYKMSETSDVQRASINTIQEFGIGEKSKYIRFTVNIDESPYGVHVEHLSRNRTPDFQSKTLFLNVLVEGSANLYVHEGNNVKRYFYNTLENPEMFQLVYKKYYIPNEKAIKENNEYRQQLFTNFKCGSLSVSDMMSVKYHKQDLVNYFVDYNKCMEKDYVDYTKNQTKMIFNLNIRPGLSINQAELKRRETNRRWDAKLDPSTSFRLGLEVEMILPFNRNKWAIITEPTYQYYKTTSTISYQVTEFSAIRSNVTIDYAGIEIPIGLRHYFYLDNTSKIFVNAMYVNSLVLGDSYVEGDNMVPKSTITKVGLGSSFGLGYNIKNKYSIEFRYGRQNMTMADLRLTWDAIYSDRTTLFQSFSVNLGYTLF